MKWTLILIVCLLTACEQQQAKLNKLSDDSVILAFGDSLTYGTGADRGQSYPSVLQDLAELTVINAGIPGEITEQGMKRLPTLLDQHGPDLLILIHGGNDILRKIPSAVSTANIRQMLTEAKQRQIQVILLGVPQPGLFLLSSAEMYGQIAEAEQIITDLDTLPDILGSNEFKSDMIHPNARGYQKLAENIYRLLQQNGAL